jgi:hypothetical protein
MWNVRVAWKVKGRARGRGSARIRQSATRELTRALRSMIALANRKTTCRTMPASPQRVKAAASSRLSAWIHPWSLQICKARWHIENR